MRRIFLYLYIVAMVFTLLFFVSMLIFDDRGAETPNEALAAEVLLSDVIIPAAANIDESGEAPVLVKESTTIVYEYYYKGDGISEITEEKPPYFLLDKSRTYFEETFVDWEVLNFSEDKVILRKSVEGDSSQHYVLGIHEGYVAVFYEDEINGTNLKEITSTPVNALTGEDRQRLEQGIHIQGNERLIKALEDFGS